MKRCALIISDDLAFREWVGNHISTRWPKMMVEHTGLPNAPMYLDRAQLDRYRLIVVRLSINSYASIVTSVFLMRILKLQSHPEIVVTVDSADELRTVKTTNLGAARCLLSSELTSASMQNVLSDLADRDQQGDGESDDGAPEIPGYKIRYPIAGTYTATLYRAFSHELGIDVALKIGEVRANEEKTYHLLTLREEYDILRKLGGEYIAKAFDYGESGDLAYLALEYFPRGCIDRVIAESGESVSRLQYMLGVAKALREIHNAGFLHLDLKPNNVLIRADGTPALIDFGISKRIVDARCPETSGFSMGSPFFMSPEQVRGEPVDERSDLFSFGALWYRVFTGRRAIRGQTLDEILIAHKGHLAPSMGNALRHYQPIIDGTVVSSPDDRFENADVLIEMIETCAATATGTYRVDFHNAHRRYVVNAPQQQVGPTQQTISSWRE